VAPFREGLYEAQRRHWRRTLLIGAGLVSIYFPLDLLHPEGRKAVLWRAAWVLALLAGMALQRAESPRVSRAATHLTALVSGAAAAAVVSYGGGTAGPRFAFIQWLPLAALLLLPHLPSVSLTVAVGSLAGGAIMIAREGRGAWFALEWGVLSFALCALGYVGTLGFRRIWISEIEAQRARGETQERLAESEQRRARAERLALVGQLAAGVAHEINNPLSFVKANLQYLGRGELTGDQREPVAEALQGVERISQIVNDLRTLVRDAEVEDELLAPGEALDEAWRLASARLRGVHATCTSAPDLPFVRGSRRLLVQALLNLLANAVDAAEEATAPERRRVAARAERDRGGVAIVVEDGGPGLAPEVARRMFEAFFTTKGVKGTGLGLALVREHVARCGGTVEGTNRPEGGARFTIWLPSSGGATESDPGTPPPGAIAPRA